MSNKFDSILGELRQADTVDISSKVPYTNATADVDIGNHAYLAGARVVVPPLISASFTVTSGE